MLNVILATLPSRGQKQFAKSLIGSLNASIIGNIRGHLRQDALEQIANSEDTPTIDHMNDAMAAIDESNARNYAMEHTGLETVMPSIEIAQKLNVLRAYLADYLAQHKATEYDVPLSIADTLQFQLKNSPDINTTRLMALAKALNKPYELLERVQVDAFQNERTALAKVAGQVLTTIEALDDDGFDDERTVEETFDSLPAHVRFKLVASAIKALNKAGENALMQLLRFNKMDGATDHTLIEGSVTNLKQWLQNFQTENATDLDAYIERGGVLPEVNMPPTLEASAILTA